MSGRHKARKSPEQTDEYGWLGLPAIYCDAYSVAGWPGDRIIRMVFSESTGPGWQPFYRAAIAMPVTDAKAFVKSLERQIERAEGKEVDDIGDNED